MFATLSKQSNLINTAILAGAAGFTCQLSELLEIRENQDGRFLADQVNDRRISIDDRAEISGLHIFLNALGYEPAGGAGDGNRYGKFAKMAFVGYHDRRAGEVFSFVEGILASRQGVTLTEATFDPSEINQKYLFLEGDINHDRRIFAIAYDLRFNLDPRRDCVKRL